MTNAAHGRQSSRTVAQQPQSNDGELRAPNFLGVNQHDVSNHAFDYLCQVAKRAPRAYQPLGAVPNGPVAPAPATAFSAARGQAQQQQQPPERRAYNPTQPPPPPPPRPPADPMVLAAAPSGNTAAGGLAPQQQNGWGGGGGLPAAQQPAVAAPVPAPAPLAREWWCPLCTYHHAGREAEFLNCAMCGSEKP
jgi:hypothetical protein